MRMFLCRSFNDEYSAVVEEKKQTEAVEHCSLHCSTDCSVFSWIKVQQRLKYVIKLSSVFSGETCSEVQSHNGNLDKH